MTKQEKIDLLLLSLLGGDKLLVDRWWNSPNKAFNSMTPNEVNNLEEIFEYLKQFLAR